MKNAIAALAGMTTLGLAACAGATTAPVGQDVTGPAPVPDLRAFPAATQGQTRHVINLPAMQDENRAKIELIVGKTQQVDCNHHFYGGQLQERTAEGWGYNYYVLDNLGNGASTLLGCPSNASRTAFVRSSSETIVRYNSRLPLVVYTPSDVELRYRVWRAGEEQSVK